MAASLARASALDDSRVALVKAWPAQPRSSGELKAIKDERARIRQQLLDPFEVTSARCPLLMAAQAAVLHHYYDSNVLPLLHVSHVTAAGGVAAAGSAGAATAPTGTASP